MEVLIADGRSEDDTRSIIVSYAQRFRFIQLLDNAAKVVPPALNSCIRQSKGEVIVRMDAHSIYPPDYISRLVNALYLHNVDNVGGVWITEPGSDTTMARCIALATSHRFGIGNADYRLGGGAPRLVDTVPFGCFPRAVFDRIGLFNEELIRNQDDEFNGRIINSGGKILLLPDVKIRYFARETLLKTGKMFYQYGLFKPLVNLKLKKPATIRQLFPPALVAGLVFPALTATWLPWAGWISILLFAIYASPVILLSIKLSSGEWRNFISLVRIFPTIHLSYGSGYLIGIFRFMLLKRIFKRKVSDPGVSR